MSAGGSLVKQIMMSIVADPGNAQATIADLSAKADELAKPHSLTVTADTAEAQTGIDAVTEALAKFDEASAQAAEAQARLAELESSGSASADELAAATDKNAEAALAARAAWMSLSEAQGAAAVKAAEAGTAEEESAAKTGAAGDAAEGAGEKTKMAFLGVAVGAGYAIDQAMKYQEQSTQLVTGAGELDKNLGMVKAGMLGLSAATATSLSQMESGMYMIESAGYHGEAGLEVLQAAAEGAKVGAADLGTVADATTTVLTDYGLKASDAASATSGLIATVAAGKTHLTDLATSLSKVLPTASALHVAFPEVAGAMATMTGEGVSARLAATHLNSTMLAMVHPSKTAAAAMAGVGLSSTQVANTLTHQGLVEALREVTEAAGEKFPVGSAAYVAAVDTMLGGQSGLSVALEVTGKHLTTFGSNVASVSNAMVDGSKSVQGWSDVQKDASFKLEQTEVSAKDAATAFGDALLPAVETVLGPISSFADFLAHSTAASTALAVVVGGALSLYLGSKLVGVFSEVRSSGEKVISTFTTIGTKLGLLGDAEAEQAVKTEALTAAQQEQAVASEEAAVAQGELDVAMDANPIGLVVIAIAALIAVIILVVTHLKDFEKWGKEAFHFVETAAEDTLNWVKGHWPLLLAILTGPIGLAVLEIKDHWHTIEHDAETTVHDVAGFFAKLPGMIIAGLADLGSMMFNAGVHAIESLIHGILSMAGDVGSAMSSIAHDIASFIGLSPAEQGPLSGGGAPEIRGAHFTAALAAGMMSGHDAIIGASNQLAQATLAGYSGGSSRPVPGAAGGYGGGGTTTIHLTVNGFVGNETQLATQIVRTLNTQTRRNGGVSPLEGVQTR